jgi:hypothetical protein
MAKSNGSANPAAVALGKRRWANVSTEDRRAAALKMVAQRKKKRRLKRPRERAAQP